MGLFRLNFACVKFGSWHFLKELVHFIQVVTFVGKEMILFHCYPFVICGLGDGPPSTSHVGILCLLCIFVGLARILLLDHFKESALVPLFFLLYSVFNFIDFC